MRRSDGRTPRGATATETTSRPASKSTANGTARATPEPDTGQTGQTGDENGGSKDAGGRPPAAAQLVKLAIDRYELGRSPADEPYVVPRPGGHVVRLLRAGTPSLSAELADLYWDATGRAAPAQARADALAVLEGKARRSDPVDTHLRSARNGDALWLDLGDVTGQVVRLDSSGWRVVKTGVPVRFRRSALTGVMPVPADGGDLDGLWRFCNVRVVDRPLVVAWLVAALMCPDVPVPAVALLGEQGTGKSSASRSLVQLVDPSPAPLRKPPRGPEEWINAAIGSRVVGLDNLSAMPDWLSDSLCRAVTGDADVRRALYTDGSQAVFALRRALVLNGIDLGALRGDLAERTLTVTLDRIDPKSRVTEAEMAREWEACRPRLLGALLDLTAGVTGVLSSLHLDGSPRMADYALVLAGVDQVLGTSGLARYSDQATIQAADTLAGNPLCAAMVERVTEPFEGTAADLLHVVTPVDSFDWRPPRGWPGNPRAVTGMLTRNAPALRQAGWVVDDLGKANEAKTTRWRLTPPEVVGKPDPSDPSHTGKPRGRRCGSRIKLIKRHTPKGE